MYHKKNIVIVFKKKNQTKALSGDVVHDAGVVFLNAIFRLFYLPDNKITNLSCKKLINSSNFQY